MHNKGETIVQLMNSLNKGELISSGKWIGEVLGRSEASLTTIEYCYYNINSTNKAIGLGGATGEATAIEINAALITSLNKYVTNYNDTNKENNDFIELKTWELKDEEVKFK